MANLSKEALPCYPSTNYYGPHVTKADYEGMIEPLMRRVYGLLRVINTVQLPLLGSTTLRNMRYVNQSSGRSKRSGTRQDYITRGGVIIKS